MLDDGTDEALNSVTLTLAKEKLAELLQGFAAGDTSGLASLFASGIDADALLGDWANGDVSLGTIEILPSDILGGNDGAYAAASDTIYLSDDLLSSKNLDRIADVLLEELGHRLDAQSGGSDTAGDEGAAFAAMVRGEAVDPASLADNTGTISVGGEEIAVEFASSVSDSGGFEGSSQSLTLEGTEGGTITYRYQHFTIPDRFIIRYEGKTLFDTGFTGGSASGEIELPAGQSDQLEIRVATNDEGTAWNYDVSAETCPVPDPYTVESQGDPFEFDADTGKCSTDAGVVIGHSAGTGSLLRTEGGMASFDRNSITVTNATVYAAIGGVSESLFTGGFDINVNTRGGDVTETGDGSFKLAGLDTEFKSVTVLRNKLAFDVAFELPENMGGGYLVDTVKIFDDALIIDANGPRFATSGRISLPDIIQFKFLDLFEVEASDVSLAYRAAEDAIRFQSKLTLGEISKLKAIDKIVADLSGDNYVQINADGEIDLVGSLTIETELKGPKGWGLKEVQFTVNSVTSEIGGSAVIVTPFGLKWGEGATIKPEVEFITQPSFQLDAVGLQIDNLNKPIPSYPLFFFQAIGGKVDNFAEDNPQDIEFSGNIGATAGPQIGGNFLARLDGDVTIDAEKIDGNLDLQILNAEFEAFGKDVSFTVLSGNVGAELDWSKSTLTVDGNLSGVDGLFSISANLKFDKDFNFNSSGTAQIGIPNFVPIFGGADVANGNYAINFSNDGNSSNDYVAGWGQVMISKLGFDIDFTAGVRANFDGTVDWLGASDLPPVGSWAVPADQEFVLLSARWENASPDTKLVVELPDGTFINEDEFAANNIAVVEEFSTDTTRTIILIQPPAGVYDILVDDETGLGTVEYFAIGETEPPSLTLTAVDAQADGTVDISFEAFDADSDANITFWYDDDLTTLDGLFIGNATELDGAGSITWDANTVVPGDYFVYAVIDDGESVQVVDSFDTSVNVGTQTDLGVSLSVDPSVTGGDPATLTVRVDNLGTELARNTSVLLTLPAAGVMLADPLPANVTRDGDTLTIDLGDIDGGDLGEISFALTTDAVASSEANFFDAYVLSDTYDGVTGNDTALVSLVVEPPSNAVIDLSVTEALVTTGPIVIGDTVTYDITVTNAGPDVAENVVLTHVIDGLTGVSFSEPSNPAGGDTFTVELGDLEVGGTATVTVTGTSDTVGTIQAVSTVTGDGTETEVTIADNESTGLFSVDGLPPEPADLSVAVNVTEPDDDSLSTISVTITNDGPGVGSNVQTQIVIPEGLELVGFSTVQGTYDPATGIWSLGNIRDNLSRTLDITVDGTNALGILDITAEIVGMDEEDPDSTPGNGDQTEDDFDSVTLQFATLIGTEENDRLFGTDEDDFAAALGGNDWIYLKDGDDRALAGEGRDFVFGGDGADLLNGEGGNDYLAGGRGVDTMIGGEGDDRIKDYYDASVVDAGDGNDRVYTGRAADTIDGGLGDDTVYSSSGDDQIDGGDGANYISAGSGNDTVTTGSGNDTVFGGTGSDEISTGDGDDLVVASSGNDVVNAGAGNDKIYASSGTNQIAGGAGDDRFFAGLGTDTFVFAQGEAGHDTISSFNVWRDKIDLTDFGFDSYSDVRAITQKSLFSTRIELAEDQTITIKGFFGLDENDFIL